MESASLVSREQFPAELPLFKDDATSLNAGVKQRAEASQENGGGDVQRVLHEEEEDALDPEDDYVDADVAPGYENLSESVSEGAMPLVSGVENENYCDEDECDSVESYNSALEGASAINDAASVEFSCNVVNDWPLYETLDASARNALRKLNHLNNRVPSMDTSLLEDVSQNEFRGKVMQLAEKRRLDLEDEAIETILSALLPVVGAHIQECPNGNGREQDVQDGDGFEDALLKKSKERNGDEYVDRQGICEAERKKEGQEANNEASYNNISASHAAANGSSSAFEHDLLMEVDEARESDVEEGIPHPKAGEATLETDKTESQPMKETLCGEQEPEVIDWDDVDYGSEVDDFPYIDGYSVAKKCNPSKETGNKGAMDDLSLQQTSEIAEMDEAVMSRAPVSTVDSTNLHDGLTEAGLEGEEKRLDKAEPSLCMSHPLDALAENTIRSMIDEEKLGGVGEFDKEKARNLEVIHERRTSILEEEDKSLSRSGSSTFEDGKAQVEVSEGEAECRSDAFKGQEKSAQREDLKGVQEAQEGARAPSPDLASLGGARSPLPVRPAGLGQSIPSLAHAPRAVQRGNTASARLSPLTNEERELSSRFSEGTEDAEQEKLQMIRVKFLRLAHRLGQPANNVVVAQVLYRLGLAEQLRGGRETGRAGGAFSFERASALAEEQEAAGSDDLDFGCTIMVLGKSGVGKS
eukprot:c29109_g1_i1 orf=194-2284(+)